MNKYFSEIKLNKKEINNLRDIVSMLEHDLDTFESHRGIEKNHFLAIQEKVFDIIKLIANIDEDIQIRVNCMIADYFNGVYAKVSDVEANLKILDKKQCECENYPTEGEDF